MRNVNSSAINLTRRSCALLLCALLAVPIMYSVRAEDAQPAPKYSLTVQNDDMGMIVGRLRQVYELRVCFESAPKDPEKDRITLDNEVKRLQALAAERELSSSEQYMLEKFLNLVERDYPADTIVDRVRHRYSGMFAGETPTEVLDAVCAEGPYGWFEENGTYVILPRLGSTLDYPVTLDVENMPIVDVLRLIAKQDPKGGLGLGGGGAGPLGPVSIGEALGKCIAPRLVLEDVAALEAMCRAVEAAGGQLAWTAGEVGWGGARMISIHPLPKLKKLWYPSPREQAAAKAAQQK